MATVRVTAAAACSAARTMGFFISRGPGGRGGRRTNVRFMPGCLIWSLVLSVVLTVLITLLIRL